MASQDTVIPSEAVNATIEYFTKLDKSSNRRAMDNMAQRLRKEQPALLQLAVAYRGEHGDTVGEAAVFYCTLIWAVFDRYFGRKLHKLTPDNVSAAKEIVAQERAKVEGLDEKPVHERYSEALAECQPHLYAKLRELIEEDVREAAMTSECAGIIFEPAQVVLEAFDAMVEGRRPGERLGPLVRATPKVGRNEPCPCGSGTKYKKCHGADE